jgi:ribosomal protein S18 acetylase RimI-like enzyme
MKALYNDIPVGAIRCSLDVPQSHTSPTRIYIMTLAVLAPYRGCGIGSTLVDHIIGQAQSMFIHEVFVHVWTENEDALEWYEKKGFKKNDLVKKYYHRMNPPGDAWIMTRKF